MSAWQCFTHSECHIESQSRRASFFGRSRCCSKGTPSLVCPHNCVLYCLVSATWLSLIPPAALRLVTCQAALSSQQNSMEEMQKAILDAISEMRDSLRNFQHAAERYMPLNGALAFLPLFLYPLCSLDRSCLSLSDSVRPHSTVHQLSCSVASASLGLLKAVLRPVLTNSTNAWLQSAA